MDAFDVYCAWCLDIGRTPPLRAWWEATEQGARATATELTAERLATYIRHPRTTPEEAKAAIEVFADFRASSAVVQALKDSFVSLEKAIAP